MHSSRRAGRRLCYASAAFAGLLLIAACSSAASGGVGASSTSGPSTSGSSSAASSQVAAAQSFVKQYEQRPTKINVPPLPAAPKPGGSIVYMNAGTPEGAVIYNSMKQAAALVGWKTVSIPYSQTNPPSINSGLDSALSLSPKPTAVVVVGVPEVVWANEIPKYEAAGVAIIPEATPTKTGGPVKGEVQGSLDAQTWGKLLANWVIADSGGTANALLVNWPDIGSFKAIDASAVATFKSGCAACSITQLNLSLTQEVNGSNDAVVSALQAHPDIKYVVSMFGQPIIGLDAAMQTAGISGVKIVGSGPALQQLQDLANGDPGAWISTPYAAYGYLELDVALRIAAGVPIADGDGGQPVVLLTKANVGTGTVTDAVQEVPVNYQALYAAAWHVSG
jgi:ribose transport system substrate-binding protein